MWPFENIIFICQKQKKNEKDIGIPESGNVVDTTDYYSQMGHYMSCIL